MIDFRISKKVSNYSFEKMGEILKDIKRGK